MTFSTQSAEYTLVFYYDASGRPVSVTMNGDVFYYVTNLQGDVFIFLVMNNTGNILEGYHYMAAQYLDDQFIVYNYSNDSTSSKTVSTLDPVYNNAGWCYGFVIGG